MNRRAPTLLSGDCPHLGKRHNIVAIYREIHVPGSAMPHYQIEEIECDYSEQCRIKEQCPLVKTAPKHPPGIGFS